MGDKAHQFGDGEDKVAGVGLLLDFTIQACFQREVRRVKLGLNTRPDRGKGIKTLGPGPLLVPGLEVAGGNIIKAGVAQDVVERLFPGYTAGPVFDNNAQFTFIVDLLG